MRITFPLCLVSESISRKFVTKKMKICDKNFERLHIVENIVV